MKAAVWFRRDLRTFDHVALQRAAHECDAVLPLFVIDPEILLQFKDAGKPLAAFFSTLLALKFQFEKRGKLLHLLSGKPGEVIPQFLHKKSIERLYFNKDYEPGCMQRDADVTYKCREVGIKVQSFKDHVLYEEKELLNLSGEPYKVFSAYKKVSLARTQSEPIALIDDPKWTHLIDQEKNLSPDQAKLWQKLEKTIKEGISELAPSDRLIFGEGAAKERLNEFVKGPLLTYKTGRDLPSIAGTSRLSVDLRSGALSPRQVWTAVKTVKDLSLKERESQDIFLSELIWRDFFISTGFNFPHVFERNFNAKFNSIKWRNNEKEFEAWCKGETGFPIVDAGMRQLVKTGFMHNRVRMITAMFLCKDLLCDWRWGEKFFLLHLMDGDHAVNNGNWQWCASTGCDAQPYFRIFNPTSQAKKYDPESEYIRSFIPELREAKKQSSYPAPIVDHAAARNRTLLAYRGSR